jgi:putative transposase
VERLAILELRAARGWTAVTTAQRFFVTPMTIASWMQRLDEEGPAALVQTREPVNRFPEFVCYLVRRLRVLCPTMGKQRIAQVLCRIGLHLGVTTAGRMLTKPNPPPPAPASVSARRIRARRPNHVWHVDLTVVPTGAGLWTSWLPWALPQRWPFCWWVVVAADHFSRRVVGAATFKNQPSSAQVRTFLDLAICEAGTSPQHLVTDRGVQFTAKAFRQWSRRRGICQRFGAVGNYGSIAIIKRLIRTLKEEGLRETLIPLTKSAFDRELTLFVSWYNQHRPHSSLDAATPDEIYFGRRSATTQPRFEPRSRWPRNAPCAEPRAPVRERRGAGLELSLRFLARRRHLPIVLLKHAA